MTIVMINGIAKTFPERTTVKAMLQSEGMDPRRVAVEIDMMIIPRIDFDKRELKSGEHVEIVGFVGGG